MSTVAFFAGGAMLIPGPRTLAERLARFGVALLPINGLRVRP